MIQVDRTSATQRIYFATPNKVTANVVVKWRNLNSNTTTDVSATSKTQGDWYYVDFTESLDLPVGMYLVTIVNANQSEAARRLAYVSFNVDEPIEVEYDTYQPATTNIVYEG